MTRYVLTFILLLITATNISASGDCFIIGESKLSYTTQSWFYCGAGNALDRDKVKSYWDDDYYITSAAYTSKGWFVVMSKGCDFTQQSYNYTASWPTEWLSEKWDDGYFMTQVSHGNGKWFIVMTKGTGYTAQVTTFDVGNPLIDFIKKYWDKDYRITAAAHYGGKWYVVMSKGSNIGAQAYRYENSYSAFKEEVRDMWNKDYLLSLVETDGNDTYFFIMSKYTDRPSSSVSQYYNSNPSDVKAAIDTHWKEGRNISYIGGTVPSASSSSTTTTTQKTHNHHHDDLVDCPACLGTGRVKCIMCHGTGTQFVGVGFNRVNCGSCGTVGSFDCATCKKTGKITKEYRQKYFQRCFRCSRNGVSTNCPSCHGLGWVTPSYYTPQNPYNSTGGGNPGEYRSSGSCSFCGGSGVCSSCSGKGGSWQDTGYYIGDHSQSWINCPSCNGSKKCFNCGGTGRQR